MTGRGWRRRAGFSLVEMVTTIAVAGVLAVGLANLLQHPLNGQIAVSRRAELTALADLAIARLDRDLRRALPNSVRVGGGGNALELMLVSTGGRYRVDPGINDPGGPSEVDHGDPSDRLSLGGDTSFNLLGRLPSRPAPYGVALATGTRLAIYPTGASIWSEAATNADPGAITPAATQITIHDDTDEDQVRISPGHTFSLSSPNARLYVVETPITYLCDPSDGSLWRVDRYAMQGSQPLGLTSAPLSGGRVARVAERIESCRFNYVAGTATRAGLATLELVLAAEGERIRMLQQVQVQNAP